MTHGCLKEVEEAHGLVEAVGIAVGRSSEALRVSLASAHSLGGGLVAALQRRAELVVFLRTLHRSQRYAVATEVPFVDQLDLQEAELDIE
jgi:50S ribosomal subunit-associated GTPase HflX